MSKSNGHSGKENQHCAFDASRLAPPVRHAVHRSGVDIPTVSLWLGHKDGGALDMKVYSHLRNQHSASMAKLVKFAPNDSNIIPLTARAANHNRIPIFRQ